ncbi:ArsR family transcriptional regulator [Luteipulveratus mongoliensis]|uniref:ArsR family transcriptional regulator n=1 Tax=Luteipulveratus mongoliensis TaxID=571913 RepID=A0A0K1JQL8_9MICO|nr:ArsR family transcriptional regulator [Luteipulveratus mongoliensis]
MASDSASSREATGHRAVGTIQDVLTALSDPVRLEMVRRLSAADGQLPCAALYDGISKSTASHHFKVLLEAGVSERVVEQGQACQRLRSAAVEKRFPGLLDSVISAANIDRI